MGGVFSHPILMRVKMLFPVVVFLMVLAPSKGGSCAQEIGDLRETLGQMREEIDVLKDRVNTKDAEVIEKIVKRVKDDLKPEAEIVGQKMEEMMEKIEALRADNLALRRRIDKNSDDVNGGDGMM